jgi:hypothetical protein
VSTIFAGWNIIRCRTAKSIEDARVHNVPRPRSRRLTRHGGVFDACRNTLKLTQPGSRAIVQSKGFVPVAQENGMLIAYATAEGELASHVGAGAGSFARGAGRGDRKARD